MLRSSIGGTASKLIDIGECGYCARLPVRVIDRAIRDHEACDAQADECGCDTPCRAARTEHDDG